MKTPNPDHPIRNTLKHLAMVAAVAAAGLTGSAQADISDALIHYDFNAVSGTTVTNTGSLGSAADGILQNATVVSGKIGNAFSFTGTSSGVITKNNVSIGNAFTFACWVSTTDGNAGYSRIITNNYGSSGYLGTDSGPKYLTILKSNFQSSATGPDTSGAWHHLVMTWDGATRKFYYDGVLNTTSAHAADTTLISKFGFGCNSGGYSEGWKGKMDEAYVFGRALSLAEVQSLYLYGTDPIVSLTSPTNNQAYLSGSPITATASVVSGTAPYTVKFFTRLLPAGTFAQAGADDTTAPYTLDLGALSGGSYEIYATVTDSAGSPVTATSETHTFSLAPDQATTTTVTSSGSPSTYGDSVTFTATVSPAPTGGTVQFYNGFDYVGSPVAVNTTTGEASVTTSTLGVVGPNEITAVYSGYQIYESSTTASPITQEVTKAPLTVTAQYVIRLKNTANPPLPYQITGFKNGQTLGTSGVAGTPALSTTAVLASPVGPYPITCTLGTLAAGNYSFTFIDATLTVVDALPTTLLTGGDAGEGWTLPSAGNVVFAVGMGTTGATLQGVTFTTSSSQLSGVSGTRYPVTLSYPSPSADDTALATIGNRLAFSGGNMNLTMTSLTAGQTYQLDQLFTAGGYSQRSMQVFVDGDGNGTVDATPIDTLNLSNPNNVFLVRTTATAASDGIIRARLSPFDNSGGGGFGADGPVLSAVVLSTIVSSGFTIWADANAGGQTAGEDFDNDGVENGVEFFMGESGSSFTANPSLNASNEITWPASAAYQGTYEVQTSPDLVTWTNVSGPKPTPSGGTLTYTLPPGAPGGTSFVRLLVTPSP